MYLWNVNGLADELRAERTTEKNKLLYYLFTVLFAWVMDELNTGGPEISTPYGLLSLVVGIAVTVLGMFYCYGVNQKGDGKCFVTRFICLSVPVTVRIAVGLIAVVVLVYGVGSAVGGEAFKETMRATKTIQTVILNTLVVVTYFYFISLAIKRVSVEGK
jgi:hypothetical protein